MEEQFKEQFVPYELSLKLKEIGFDERCLAGYYNDGKSLWFFRFHKNSEREPTVAERFATAPLWEQAFNWFMYKHNIIGNVQYFINSFFCYTIDNMEGKTDSKRLFTEYKTYEEARLECLEKLIQLVEQKKDSV